ncbi:RNA-directed DNA polymerase [Aquabacterium sp. OR-4]|uniref:RNA-directed DNA polymerase n=1 Tax=Aquabacterium sp. OR-4 TaxID=2978127 RepID=UPI0028C6CB4A|nr:RNA-directed DNA polymerase [Aquabacterium sp. OR-4]MDT7834125.1 RNA-directed DNA polymerase [Aquabacterium sp. OR-4]
MAKDRATLLLGKGYFPSQLPPAFTTQQLAAHAADLQAVWAVNDEKPTWPACKAELFSVARAGHQRRTTSITNPVPQLFLATFVARHWRDFLRHYRKSRLSRSHPRFLNDGGRAACIPSMQRLHDLKVLESAGYRYMLRTDISRFFPTIYTHSVPWALHTKEAAKAKENRYKTTPDFFGNLIDKALRQGQDEQTMGLPIGPDTSHVVAEAISTSVDLLFATSLGCWPAGFRYVDDYFLFFPNVAAAEAALAALSSALKEFELQINFEKTKICSVAEIVDDYWTHQLRSFQIDKHGRRQRSDIHHFFELANDLARTNADENVMAYALKRASSVLIRHENWELFEARLCHVALSHPNTLQTIAQVLATYKFYGYPLNVTRITRTVVALIQEHAGLGHHSEVAWCLWMCKELEIQLDPACVGLVSVMPSSVCALLLMDLSASGFLAVAPKENFWRTVDGAESLREELWLMCYEAGVRGWGGFTSAHALADSRFKDLAERGIRFYDPAARSKLLFKIREAVLKELTPEDIDKFFDRDDADDFLEYDESDGGYEGVIFDEEPESMPAPEDDLDEAPAGKAPYEF